MAQLGYSRRSDCEGALPLAAKEMTRLRRTFRADDDISRKGRILSLARPQSEPNRINDRMGPCNRPPPGLVPLTHYQNIHESWRRLSRLSLKLRGVPFTSGATVRFGGPSSWGRPRALLPAVPAVPCQRFIPGGESWRSQSGGTARLFPEGT